MGAVWDAPPFLVRSPTVSGRRPLPISRPHSYPVFPEHASLFCFLLASERRAHRTSGDAHRAALLGTVEQLVRSLYLHRRDLVLESGNLVFGQANLVRIAWFRVLENDS
jgi:hypothetical protein